MKHNANRPRVKVERENAIKKCLAECRNRLNDNATKPLNVCIYGENRLYFASLHIDITGPKANPQ